MFGGLSFACSVVLLVLEAGLAVPWVSYALCSGVGGCDFKSSFLVWCGCLCFLCLCFCCSSLWWRVGALLIIRKKVLGKLPVSPLANKSCQGNENQYTKVFIGTNNLFVYL